MSSLLDQQGFETLQVMELEHYFHPTLETVQHTIQAYKEVRSNMKIRVLFGSQE